MMLLNVNISEKNIRCQSRGHIYECAIALGINDALKDARIHYYDFTVDGATVTIHWTGERRKEYALPKFVQQHIETWDNDLDDVPIEPFTFQIDLGVIT
jgi:hypothetical protein